MSFGNLFFYSPPHCKSIAASDWFLWTKNDIHRFSANLWLAFFAACFFPPSCFRSMAHTHARVWVNSMHRRHQMWKGHKYICKLTSAIESFSPDLSVYETLLWFLVLRNITYLIVEKWVYNHVDSPRPIKTQPSSAITTTQKLVSNMRIIIWSWWASEE